MLDLVLLIAGAGGIIAAGIYLYRDCRGSVSPSMGGEMMFSGIWLIGSLLFAIGLAPVVGISRWWAILAVPAMFGLSFPMRIAVQRMGCTPCVEEPSGFQKFVRETEREKK